MAVDFTGLLRDLQKESDWLLDRLYDLTPESWDIPTPADGWAIRDQVSHLAFFDDFAYLALTEPDRFRVEAARLMARGNDFPDRVAEDYRHTSSVELLDWFSSSRGRLVTVFEADDARRRLPWFGPDMSVASSATARLMETWAHGQDIYDALEIAHPISPGLRSIAHLGVSTFAFAHRLNGVEVPPEPVRIELDAPDFDEIWAWGPEDATNRVLGPAEDFVLAVTQRRHLTDTELKVEGDVAMGWMGIAQAYAGAPGRGRPSRTAQRPNGRT